MCVYCVIPITTMKNVLFVYRVRMGVPRTRHGCPFQLSPVYTCVHVDQETKSTVATLLSLGHWEGTTFFLEFCLGLCVWLLCGIIVYSLQHINTQKAGRDIMHMNRCLIPQGWVGFVLSFKQMKLLKQKLVRTLPLAYWIILESFYN